MIINDQRVAVEYTLIDQCFILPACTCQLSLYLIAIALTHVDFFFLFVQIGRCRDDNAPAL